MHSSKNTQVSRQNLFDSVLPALGSENKPPSARTGLNKMLRYARKFVLACNLYEQPPRNRPFVCDTFSQPDDASDTEQELCSFLLRICESSAVHSLRLRNF